jgi:hypothetical protein
MVTNPVFLYSKILSLFSASMKEELIKDKANLHQDAAPALPMASPTHSEECMPDQ